MAEFTNTAVQTIAAGQNVLLSETPVRGSDCISHREGSGIVTLRGRTNQCSARYKVSFGGNIAVPTGGTAGPISLAISLDGETLASTAVVVTPTAVGAYFNVFSAAYICVPRGCCTKVSVKNIGTGAVSVANANIIVERVA